MTGSSSVISRLRALADPITDDYGDLYFAVARERLSGLPTLRPLQARAVLLVRVKAASAPLSLRHIFRRVHGAVLRALRHHTEEMTWFRTVKP